MSENAYYEKGIKIIAPASVGGHNWQSMSYSPRTGLVYIPIHCWGLTYAQDPTFKFRPGPEMNQVAAIGVDTSAAPSGALIVWDPIKQREVWRAPQPEMLNGGTIATAGDLVFSIDGVQYIMVLVGKGDGAMGMPDANRPRIPRFNGRMLVFKLGGKATLPAFDDLTLPPANPLKDACAIDIADRIGEAGEATLARLERAMASAKPAEGEIDTLLAKQDTLPVLA